jgi:hypothetical protein
MLGGLGFLLRVSTTNTAWNNSWEWHPGLQCFIFTRVYFQLQWVIPTSMHLSSFDVSSSSQLSLLSSRWAADLQAGPTSQCSPFLHAIGSLSLCIFLILGLFLLRFGVWIFFSPEVWGSIDLCFTLSKPGMRRISRQLWQKFICSPFLRAALLAVSVVTGQNCIP